MSTPPDGFHRGTRRIRGTIDQNPSSGFLEEVERFIKGDVPGASLSDSKVRLEEGSVKLVAFVAQLLAMDVRADLA
jgi:hypothetical protein